MNEKDKKEFAQIMTALAENFGATISRPGMAMRFDALKGYPMAAVRQGSISILKNRKHRGMPTVAEFIEAIERTSKPSSIPAKAQAQLQANIVIGIVEGTHYEKSDELDDVTHRLIRKGRFALDTLRRTLMVDNYNWFIRDFVEAYMAMRMQIDSVPQIAAPDNKRIDRREDLNRLISGMKGV